MTEPLNIPAETLAARLDEWRRLLIEAGNWDKGDCVVFKAIKMLVGKSGDETSGDMN